MRIVLDTNVVVSAMLTARGTCAEIVELIRDDMLTVLLCDRIVDEYAAVLARPEFGFPAATVRRVLRSIIDGAEFGPVTAIGPVLADPGDQVFVDLALSADADAIVTGNRRHFAACADQVRPAVLSPRELVDRVRSG